jgi:hypothetical protein
MQLPTGVKGVILSSLMNMRFSGEFNMDLPPRYTMRDNHIFIEDPVWGSAEIGRQPGDEVFLELRDLDLVRRTAGIEQLTLGKDIATIPGTSHFSRWEHIWGSVLFVRKMTEGLDMDPRERLILQLRTFVSDLGHTAFSHLGDWMFQDDDSEDMHDRELEHILEIGGVTDVLRRYDIEPAEVIFPDKEDWIECPSPQLCVDRVDYGAREIRRWLDLNQSVRGATSLEGFDLVDNQIVMKNQEYATAFGRAFMLLATEHWGEPVHRLQLKLKEMAVKWALTRNDELHPRDQMYGVDVGITREMLARSRYIRTLWPIMSGIARDKREAFTLDRVQQLGTFLMDADPSYPHPLEEYDNHRSGTNIVPSNISLIPVEDEDDISDFGENRNTVDVYLPAVKPRVVDPKFILKGKIVVLSKVDRGYAQLMALQGDVAQQNYVGRIHCNSEARQTLYEGMNQTRKRWDEAVAQPRVTPEVLRRIIHDGYMQTALDPMILLQHER